MSTKKNISIFWFRQDLRIADNPGLSEAISKGSVLPIYIYDNVNSKEYSRITILSKWKFDIKKVTDVKPASFFPKPKIYSSVLEFKPKKKIIGIKNQKNLEKVTKVFFSQRRKMIKKPINILFKNLKFDYKKFNINPSDRPQNIDVNKYLKIVNEYENLRS